MAVFPVNINELEITFQRLNRTTISLDPDFGEPIGDDLRFVTTTTMIGQANFAGGPIGRRLTSLSGDSEPADGHVVIRFEDMVAAGLANSGLDPTFVLSKGDRIIQVASQVVDFEIIEIRPESPLETCDADALLIYIDFVQGREERTGIAQ